MVNENIRHGIDIPSATTIRKDGLASCPFCGGEAIMVKYKDGVFVKCTCCDVMMAQQISVVTETIIPFLYDEDAVKAWNKRRDSVADAKIVGGRAEDVETILRRRASRAKLIADAVKTSHGECMSVAEIAETTKLSVGTIKNHMAYVKDKYPQVKSQKGKAGYYWEVNYE